MPLTTVIEGLTYVSGYLDRDDQTELLATVDSLPWRDDLRRRVQHYGYRYDYTRKRVDPDLFLGPLPEAHIPSHIVHRTRLPRCL